MHISHARDDVPAAPTRADATRSQNAINLTSLWEYIVKTKSLPPNVKLPHLYSDITRRLRDPEWEVRQHALRVLSDVIVATDDYSLFPLKSVVDNLGHSSPTVRKAALDTLKAFVWDSDEPGPVIAKIVGRVNVDKTLLAKDDVENNIVTGIILSTPSLMLLLKKRNMWDEGLFDLILMTLSWRLFDVLHSDVAFKALVKLKKFTGSKYFYEHFIKLDSKIIDKYKLLCHLYEHESDFLLHDIVNVYEASVTSSDETTTYSTETDSPLDNLDAAITLTVLEETGPQNIVQSSDDSSNANDRNQLKYSSDNEDSDLVVSNQKRVTFGGEIVKVRTPDSENTLPTDEDEVKKSKDKIIKSKSLEPIKKGKKLNKKSGIPLPVISSKPRFKNKDPASKIINSKSKSLSELYNLFRTNTTPLQKQSESRRNSSTLQLMPPEKIPSPVEPHREIEVLHNLQSSPKASPPRTRKVISIEEVTDDGDIIYPTNNLAVSTTTYEPDSPLKEIKYSYDWEKLNIIGKDVVNQLHNTDNWISAVRSIDKLQRALTDKETVRAIEVAGPSLVDHMWTLGDVIKSARAPSESVVCTLLRGASLSAVRNMLPSVLPRLSKDPLPTALPHALLSQFSLPELVRIILDWVPSEYTLTSEIDESRLKTLECVARAAGPAALLAAVRRALPDSKETEQFLIMLRARLRRPMENWTPAHRTRSNGAVTRLPSLTKTLGERRRARSTPPPTAKTVTLRVRSLADSAPPGGGPHQTASVESLLPLVTFKPNRNADVTVVSVPFQDVESERKPTSPAVSVHVDLNNIDHDFTVVITNEVRPSSRPIEYQIEEPDTNEDKDAIMSRKSSEGNISIGEISQNSHHSLPSEKSVLNIEVITPTDSPQKPKINISRPSSSKSIQSNKLEVVEIEDEAPIERQSPQHLIPTKDVSSALAAHSSIPPRNEDWEATMASLETIERLASDRSTTAPVGSWRTASRAVAGHVKSPRSRVARAACKTLGTLFSFRGKEIELETDEAAGALLDRTADANKFLRADASDALKKLAFGVTCARAAAVLAKRGAYHRAGPARATTAKVLADLASEEGGPAKLLKGQVDVRSQVLQAAADLLVDASPEARSHARKLMTALAEEPSFHTMLKESITPSKYKSIERSVDMLRTR